MFMMVFVFGFKYTNFRILIIFLFDDDDIFTIYQRLEWKMYYTITHIAKLNNLFETLD